MDEYFELDNGTQVPIADYCELEDGQVLPVLDIPMMTDEKWNALAEKKQARKPGKVCRREEGSFSMNEIKVFENQQFGQLRTVNQDGQLWFVAADVCRALDIGNPADAVSRLDEDEKNTIVLTEGIPGNPNKTVVNEPGLYSLVLGSRKPEARAFKRWITHEVIPSIRKTGSYTAPGVDEKKQRAEAMLMNAKTRFANMWVKIGDMLPESPQHKQICASYASEALTGRKVIALPAVEKTYSAEEVGKLYGISGNMVGRIANQHGLKTDEYGITVMDKSRHSAKEMPTFRYNDRGAAAIGRYLQDKTA